MSHVQNISAAEALHKLKVGNREYVESGRNGGDVSAEIRHKTAEEGQHPYAIIITCSDARVIPETIFSAGLGDLFTIQVAGNVIDDHQLGSIEYAESHLGSRLIVVLGHTKCGAIQAALHPNEDTRFIPSILEDIREAIGNETDDHAAAIQNIRHSIHHIENSFEILEEEEEYGLEVIGALYDIETGQVEFLSEL